MFLFGCSNQPYTHTHMHTHTRGEEFRPDYANISELRSIVPSSANLMALTATVTSSTRKVIMKNLCMDEMLRISFPTKKIFAMKCIQNKMF